MRKLSLLAVVLFGACQPPVDETAAPAAPIQRSPRVDRAYAEASAPVRLLRPPAYVPPELEHEVRLNPAPHLGHGGVDPVLQSLTGQLNMPSTGLNFLAQGDTLDSATVTGTPPDTNGAVGPNHFVQVVNGGIAIWSKGGALLWGSKLLNVLWAGYTGTNAGNGCATRNDGDPIVLYDQLADRWLVAQFSVPNYPRGPSYECVAVSQTPDPTGSWNRYDFQYPDFNDYPKLSVWPDAYYATYNAFTRTSVVGADLCALDRAAMIAGSSATQVCFQQANTVFGALPANVDGPIPPPRGEPGFFLEFATTDNAVNLWKMHVDWVTPANSTLSGPTSVTVANFTTACTPTTTSCIPEPGGVLDSLSDRLMFRLVYRNYGAHEVLLANHSVKSGTTGAIRWYELRSPAGTPTVFQQGTYTQADSNWRWMGSLAEDQAENMALGYSLSSTTANPGIAWAGRLAGDASGTMGQAEVVLDTGAGVETGASRWGDYSSMWVDPGDDCTFWYTQELYHATGEFTWDTYVASTKFTDCAANDFSIALSPPAQSVVQSGTVNYTVTTASTKGTAETIALFVQDLPTGVTGSFAPTSVTAGSPSTLTLSASAAAPNSPLTTFTVIGKAPSAVHAATAQVSVGLPPTVSFTSPANGATVSGTVSVSATAAPAAGTTLTSLAISIDGTQVVTGATSPQSYSWNTTTATNGTHTLVATAVDANGGSATTTITVTVKNPPAVAITAPANGATVSGTVTVTATGAAPAGTSLSSLAISIDSAQVASGAGSPQNYSWNTTAATNGIHTLTATATDADGGTATATITVTVKNNPTVSFTAPANGATVSGTVTVTAAAGVPGGTTLSALSISIDGVSVMSGATSPQNFTWNTATATDGSHTLSATATDADGGTATTTTTVTVKNPPVVAVTAPANGATVSGTVTVTATGAAPAGTSLSSLAISIDGAQVASGAGSPQNYSWNTTAATNGTHTLTATATDADGGTATATITVTVKNNPTVSFTAPANGATVSGTVTVTAAAGVPGGTTLSALSISIDGVSVMSGATTPQSYSWNTATAADGSHTLTATATDADGGNATTTITVTVKNPPSVAITAPANGATVSGTATLTGTGAAPAGTTLATLSLSIDGVQVASGGTPQGYTWDTTLTANGAHTLSATATDADGAAATASIPVTVLNGPVVAFTAPAVGATVAGSTNVTAQATPPGGASLMTLALSLDGASVASAGISPLTDAWDTTSSANGPHAFTATATDVDGATGTATLNLTVANPPTVAVTAPAGGATLSGTVQASASASPPAGTTLATLVLQVDGTLVQSGSASPLAFSWDTRTAINGAHTLTAVATDADGTHATSAPVAVTVNNPGAADAGAPDAGGSGDGGSLSDGGSPTDAGAGRDGGAGIDAGPRPEADSGSESPDAGGNLGVRRGCGCAGGGSGGAGFSLTLLGMVVAAQARRRKHLRGH